MALVSLLVIAVAYLLGAIAVGYLFVRLFLKQDVRLVGSGRVVPVWFCFHCGNGVATGFGVFLVAARTSALAAIAVFPFVLLLTRYVSLAFVLGAASLPLSTRFLVHGEGPPLFFPLHLAPPLLIIAKHHQNSRRILNGSESCLETSSRKQESA
jgi:glycerol-3-phosphate acyltransferase PlsY